MITPGIIDVEPLLPPLRPLREFLAYTSLRNHKQPLRARILDSITFFQTNYLLINMIMLCLPMLFSYLFFPVLILALSLFFFLAYHKSDNIIVLRRIKVTKNLAILTCLFALVLLVLVSGMYTTLFVGYIFTVFFVMSHACLTDRRRTQPSFQQDDSNGASRIFDPEEIIRRDEMQRRNFQQPMTGYSTSNRFMTPGTIQPTSYEPTSSDASTTEDDSKRYKKEKIEQTRKRIKENYGLE
ncbi:hypothetical protein NAEGRDRAFT_79154 [Naegleria gruberi]|uniref:PRA1 family protein n=1 Tax=Naegleria gruberi TaxID=5762 RepID=D2V9X8_NAEGR|nr:uncharacterized protein NAEGRDRAFT_79154 [Naegleria gruberi]EFC46328.1 hypothetical protein NAEGRDRAFT_79154 [Naegleria gruberi]|eukprot:XP_002679072.1 hypothetical protein NAEGRDRAFT_79154 [Naegleria gruberi strain NEG-M]